LLHRLGLEYHKPEVIPRKLKEEKQKEFIAAYGRVGRRDWTASLSHNRA
jgi:hypothetical protein